MKKLISVCLGALLLCSLCSCAFSFSSGTYYENAEKYSLGNATVSGKITALDLHWTSGKLILVTAEDGSDAVTLSETARLELTDEYRVHYWLDGEVLRVQYAASGQRAFPSNLNKTLTLTVPASLTAEKLTIETSSAEVDVTGLCAADVEISTASGAVRAELSGTDTVRVDTASGSAKLTLDGASSCLLSTASGSLTLVSAGKIGTLRADSSSGSVTLTLPDADRVEANSTSGEIRVTCPGSLGSLKAGSSSGDMDLTVPAAGSIETDTSSGRVRVTCAGMPEKLKIETSSGDVNLTLPADAEFTLEYDTASGDFDCDYPITIRDDLYISGSGKTPISVDTASGNLTVRRAAG